MKRVFALILTPLMIAWAASAKAQAPQQSEIDQLKAQVEILKTQQASSQHLIESLEKKIEAIETPQPTAVSGQTAATQTKTAEAQRPITVPVSDRAPELQSRELFSDPRIAAPRIDNVPLSGDLEGFFRIGDTSTVIRPGGYARVDLIHDFRLPGNPDLFVTSTLPLGPVPSANSTNVHTRQSRVNLEIRRPTALGELRVFYENDFFGAGPDIFHLRHLYGQVGNLLAGKTFSTFMDVDSFPDTLDFEGPNALVNVAQPQIRFTLPLTKANSLAFSVEKPTTDINVTNPINQTEVATPTTPVPDFVVRYRYEVPRGHVQFGTVLRSVGGFLPTNNGFISKHVLGWGLNLTGAVQVFEKDSILFQGAYGEGIGRYIQDLNGLGADSALNSSNQLVATPAYATFIAYQHKWNKNWRSTGSYGYVHLQEEFGHPHTFFDKSHYGSFNLIWNVATLNLGAEYLYGLLEAKDGRRGYGSRLQFSMQYNFFKWERNTE
jgi:hypothetical protein